MQATPGSFHWSEDLDESVNYWFWLHHVDGLPDEVVVERVREFLQIDPLPRHFKLEREDRWRDYLPVWEDWKRAQVTAQIHESRGTDASIQRRHYESVASVGLKSFHVQWVAAPVGERWLLPPDVAVLGVDGASAEDRRNAVLEAARALRLSR
jgi:hypothetical protein